MTSSVSPERRLQPVRWVGDGLMMLDQRRLPRQEVWVRLETADQVADAIRDMVVRGAPAIGISAAYGLALAAGRGDDLGQAADVLLASRPTAVNLRAAVERIQALATVDPSSILAEALALEQEDLDINLRIGRNGLELIEQDANILTICNTGAIATAGHGTALGIVRSAHEAGRNIHVWSCETRPRQQGLKLTAFELIAEGIPFHSIADGVAASLMAQGKVDIVLAGADRIAANGDTANKVGTYALAILANYHRIPFVVAAPTTTFDPRLGDGSGIPIEERAPEELTEVEGVRVAPDGTPVYNPGFDVTPASLISAIVTETGVYRPPYDFSFLA